MPWHNGQSKPEPYSFYRMVPLSMTLSDNEPDFNVTFSTFSISETTRFYSYYIVITEHQ